MTSAQIITMMNGLCSDYQYYLNSSKLQSLDYHDRVYYCGLAITTLQNIKDLATAYPAVIGTMPIGVVPDYSDVSFTNLVSLQSKIYRDQLVNMRRNIDSGRYRLGDEMAIKIERARNASAVANSSTNLNVSQAALEERNRARMSVVGTALKYPIHATARIIQGVSRLAGNIISLPLHIFAYPMHMIVQPNHEYTGRMVTNAGDTIGRLISGGVRLLDNSIMRL